MAVLPETATSVAAAAFAAAALAAPWLELAVVVADPSRIIPDAELWAMPRY
jgi:hypothetical protein